MIGMQFKTSLPVSVMGANSLWWLLKKIKIKIQTLG